MVCISIATFKSICPQMSLEEWKNALHLNCLYVPSTSGIHSGKKSLTQVRSTQLKNKNKTAISVVDDISYRNDF